MPNEKKSAASATRSAVTAARGISIMVPIWYSTLVPAFASTSAATFSARSRNRLSSSSVPTSGIMISGSTPAPPAATAHAASMMARTCMS